MYRKNLDAAYAAAASTPGAANALVTAAEQPWEQVANMVQVKSGFGANGVKVSVPSQTFVADAESEFGDAGANVAWSTNKWANSLIDGSDITDGLSAGATTSSATLGADYGAPKAFDNGLTHPSPLSTWATEVASAWIQIDLGAVPVSAINRASFYISSGMAGYTASTVTKIEGSDSSDMSGSTTLWTGSQAVSANDTWVNISFDNSTTFRYIRTTASRNSTYVGFTEIKYLLSSPASTLNTFTSDDFVAGGSALSFDPSSLVLKTLSSGGSDVTTNIAIEYSTDNKGTWAGPYTVAEFKVLAASLFVGCSYLNLRFQLTGAQTLGYVSMDTYATSGLMTKAGNMTLTGDISLEDASLSGGLEVDDSVTEGVNSVTTAAGTTVGSSTDNIVVFTGSTTQTYTLPACATGRKLVIKNRSSGTVTVNRAGADTIDGGTSFTLTGGTNAAITLYGSGTDWVVV